MTPEERTRRVVADVLGLPYEEVTRETSHTTVRGWDSLGIIKVALAIEAEFAVKIGIEDASRFLSVADILAALRTRGMA
jgi:acyl carrier protein